MNGEKEWKGSELTVLKKQAKNKQKEKTKKKTSKRDLIHQAFEVKRRRLVPLATWINSRLNIQTKTLFALSLSPCHYVRSETEAFL